MCTLAIKSTCSLCGKYSSLKVSRASGPPCRIIHCNATSTPTQSKIPAEIIEAAEELKKTATRPIDDIIDEKVVNFSCPLNKRILFFGDSDSEILKQSTFPIAPDDLIVKAKEALKNQYDGFLARPELVDTEKFVFKGPVIGPLTYQQLLRAIKGFSIDSIFPGYQSCFHNFWVDPYEPSRVWYTQRFYGRHDGKAFGKEPTGKIIDSTPCMHSFVFNEEGKIVKCTVGYPMDRDVGNTGGLGGLFGPLWAIGAPLPFPEGKPYKRSWQFKLFNLVSQIGLLFSKRQQD